MWTCLSVMGRSGWGGDTGPPTMVGTTQDLLEAGVGREGKSGDGGTHTHGRTCRDENNDDRDTRIGKGTGGGGVTGSQWLQWGGMERDRGLRPTHFEDRIYTGRTT